jgi:oligopeptide/dipeptide ABC transporter ATP-binding protein
VSDPLLEVCELSVSFAGAQGLIPAIRDVTLQVEPSEAVAIVGESGSGKTTVLRAIVGLLADSARASGSVRLRGQELLGAPEAQMRSIRGSQVGLIFQDPVNCFNPSMTIGAQLRRALRLNRPDIPRAQREAQILAMLEKVGIDARGKLDDHPYQFSQGQLQRIMIALVCIGCQPALVLADEPTTSLDVTSEAQVLELLRQLRLERSLALVLVTHNLAVAAQLCERVIVMYAGRIVETASTEELFQRPAHPYTRQLLATLPRFPHEGGRLSPIPGEPAGAPLVEHGCAFAPRCAQLIGAECAETVPGLIPVGAGEQRAACLLYAPKRSAGVSARA